MALVLADRVRETTTTAGSGTITLAGAEPGYQSFSAIGNGNQTYYVIAGDTEWEVGIGTYTASGTTLSRDTVLSSSASGAKVTFSAGSKRVFVSYPSEKSVNLDVSGNISLSSAVISGVAYPTVNSDAATKLYVDTMVSSGITYHEPVKYEVPNTTGNLNATYNNGTAGVSATLTNAGSLVPFIPDGVTASISDRVLVYSQTNAYENGVYTVTVVGNGSTAWVLTRASDADTYALKSPNGLGQGDAFFVTSGDTGAGETYLCNTSGTIVFGSTAISFVQISSAQVYKAGNGISLTNTTISLVSPVAVANGGTGTTATPTNGQLLIGNGTGYALSTLTAGSGVSITNSAGSITLSATGLGGTVTAVTATGPLASSGGTTPDISIANSTGTGSVVLQSDATIFSATITAATSASITTITGSSANITTVTGTTAGFSSAAITQLSGTSAGITTVSGTTTTFSSGTISQFGATSATITTLSGTNVSYPNASFTSASITNLALTSLTLSNLSIASANITTLTGTNLSYASATITTGNLAFSGTGQRITGDMSNATIASRLAFQSSTANNQTILHVLPNGSATSSGISCEGDSATTNGTIFQFLNNPGGAGDARINASIRGTGSYLPLAIYTGGSERMRLDTSGNLGIGTTSPNAKTTLVQGTQTYGFAIQANSSSEAGNIRFTNSGFTAEQALISSVNGGGLTFNTGSSSTERMRIDSSGNVGIGTASPGSLLHLSAGTTVVQRIEATSTNPAFVLYKNNGSDRMYVGTENSTGAGIIGTGAAYAGVMSTASTNPLVFGTNSAERMRIDSSGNVSIGTTANTLAGSVFKTIINYAGGGVFGLNNSNNTNQSWGILINDSGLGNAGRFNIVQNVNGSTGGYGGGPCVPIISADPPSAANTTPRLLINSGGNVTMSGSLSMSGQITTRTTTGTTPIVNGGGSNSLQVMGDVSNGAWFSFHRSGAYAINMGLDTSNVLTCGGWSDGANYRWQVDTSGNFTARGNVTAYSDERVKKNWRPVQENLIEKISAVKSGVYDRTDADLTQVGVSAQSLREVLPEAVLESNGGELSVAYGNAALVAVIELAKEVVKLRAEVEALKAAK